jgi:type I restriction enzyme S subunit
MNEEQSINQLPKGWKKQKFAEVIEFLTDFQANGSFAGLKDNVQYYSEKNYAVLVRLKDLRHGLKDEVSFVYTDEKGYNFLKKSRVVEGDILVANVGAGVGTTLIMPKFLWKATLGPNMFRVDLKETISKKFFFAFSNSLNYWQQLRLVSAGSGQPKINKSQYRRIEIRVPPLETQEAIVFKIEELFSELDKGIENLRTVQQQLKTYRQSVLKWAFEGKLTNENVKEGELPKGWRWVELKEMIDKIRCGSGVVPSNEISNYPILRSSSVRAGKINFTNIKYVQKVEKIKKDDFIIKGDLLFTRLNGSINYVGNCAKVPDVFPNNLIYPDRLFRMRLLKPEYADYIMHFFATSIARRIIEKNAKSTAGHMRISTPDITDILIPLCPDEEQHKIVQEIESRLSVADKMEESITQSLQQAEALRQSILKKAFEGKLIN